MLSKRHLLHTPLPHARFDQENTSHPTFHTDPPEMYCGLGEGQQMEQAQKQLRELFPSSLARMEKSCPPTQVRAGGFAQALLPQAAEQWVYASMIRGRPQHISLG